MSVIDALKNNWGELSLTAGIFILLLLVLLYNRSHKTTINKSEFVHRTMTQKAWRVVCHVLRLAGFAILTIVLVTLGIMFYRVYIVVNRDTAPAPSRVEIPADLPFKVEEIQFASEDGLQMAGWFVPSKNGATIILLHGYGGNRTGMLWQAERLVAAGYGVLMYDERASGESGGTHRSYGWEDPRDARGAIKFIKEEYGTDSSRIGMAGCSMGAQIALQGAAYNPEIEAVWADGTGTIRAQDIPPQHNILLKLVVAGNYMTDWASEIKLGMKAPAPLIDIIGDIAPRPITLVGSGVQEPLIGSEGDFMLYYAKYTGGNTEVWIIPEAPHCGGPAVRPEEYAARMTKFFDIAFGINR